MSDSLIKNEISSISSIEDIIIELKLGNMIILVDEEDRENEGDLLIAADFVSAESINFMITHGRGLVCLTLTEEHCKRLGLSMMTNNNGSRYGTNFTQSIEAAKGVGTGISAFDRAHTIKVSISNGVKPDDLVQPGHIFPVQAVPGGVLSRAGHTEAGCDLTMLAGLTPAAVICEILNHDGSMARLPDLLNFSAKHGIKIGTIDSLIKYRGKCELLINRFKTSKLDTIIGEFSAFFYQDTINSSIHIALVHGDIDPNNDVLVIVHESSSVLDLIFVGDSIPKELNVYNSLKKIKESSSGVLLLMNCNNSYSHFFDSINNSDELKFNLTKNKNISSHICIVGAQILRDVGVVYMKLLSYQKNIPFMDYYDFVITGYDFM